MDEDDGARDLHRRETGSRFVSWHVATGHRRRMQAQGVPRKPLRLPQGRGDWQGLQGVVKEAPWDTFKPSKAPAPVTLIPAKGLELRCNRLNIFQLDGRKIQEQSTYLDELYPMVPLSLISSIALTFYMKWRL